VAQRWFLRWYWDAFDSDIQCALANILGTAVQIDPIKPMLKAPGSKRLKLEYDELLSNFGFNINLRRYTWARRRPQWPTCTPRARRQGLTLVHFSAQRKRFMWNRGFMKGAGRRYLAGAKGVLGWVQGVFCVRNGSG